MDELLTQEEAAAILGMTVSGIRYLRDTQQLTFRKYGTGRVKVPRVDVVQLKIRRDSYATAV